jgi:hypothetical protein
LARRAQVADAGQAVWLSPSRAAGEAEECGK